MATILVNTETGGVFKALDEGQLEAFLNHPSGNWKKLDDAAVTRESLAAQVKKSGAPVDTKKADLPELAEALLTQASNRLAEREES